MKRLALYLVLPLALAGCNANNTPPQTPIPGEKNLG